MKISKEMYDLYLNRTKEVLNIRFDKALAELLGIAPTTFNTKKMNLNFPDTELRALSSRRPDLKIDFDYIYTGIRQEKFENDLADAGINSDYPELLSREELSDEERRLLQDFRRCDREGKNASLKITKALADQREHLSK